jgi:bifunctional non-homologous end joining protein LigD
MCMGRKALMECITLVYFLFDLLFLDGEDLTGFPLSERKARLASVMSRLGPPLQYSDHQVGHGPIFYAEASKLGLEGIVSKRPMFRATAVYGSRRNV